MVLGILFVMFGMISEPRRGIFPLLAILAYLGGIAFAIYQMLLINIDSMTSSCGYDLPTALQYDYPLQDVIMVFFTGSESCSEQSIFPYLSAAGFFGLIVISVIQFILGPRSKRP